MKVDCAMKCSRRDIVLIVYLLAIGLLIVLVLWYFGHRIQHVGNQLNWMYFVTDHGYYSL